MSRLKVKISYTDQSEQEAAATVAALRSLFPDVKPKYQDKYSPYKHIYITTPEPKSPEIGHEKKTLDF